MLCKQEVKNFKANLLALYGREGDINKPYSILLGRRKRLQKEAGPQLSFEGQQRIQQGQVGTGLLGGWRAHISLRESREPSREPVGQALPRK